MLGSSGSVVPIFQRQIEKLQRAVTQRSTYNRVNSVPGNNSEAQRLRGRTQLHCHLGLCTRVTRDKGRQVNDWNTVCHLLIILHSEILSTASSLSRHCVLFHLSSRSRPIGQSNYHKRSLAKAAPSTRASNLAQAMSGSTAGRSAKVAKPQSAPAITRSRPTLLA